MNRWTTSNPDWASWQGSTHSTHQQFSTDIIQIALTECREWRIPVPAFWRELVGKYSRSCATVRARVVGCQSVCVPNILWQLDVKSL